ncbi:MAG: hypothetical protein WB711_22575 [Terriglobales bacterium]
MRSNYFLPIVLFALTNPCLRAQAQSTSDNATGDRSWTATSQQQLPSSENPTRTSETHSTSGGRSIDSQHIENMGMDGHYEPYMDVQKETIRVDANTTRTVERTFGRASDGGKTLVQVTEEEQRTLPGGEVKVVRTTSDPDANGSLQTVQREIRDTRQISTDLQETKSTLLTASPNGGLTASMQTTERETKAAGNNVEFRKSTSLPDSNGNWQLSEVREGTIKDDGKDRIKEESVLRPGTDGNLSVVERTVSKESENAAGEKRKTVETYSTNLPGTPIDGSLRLNQQVTTVHRKGEDGRQSTETLVEQRNPADPSNSLRLTQEAIDIVRPGISGTSRETQTLKSLDPNGDLGVVSVDTRKQDNSPAVQISIVPPKTAQPATAH